MCGIYGMASLRGEPLAHPEVLPAMGRSLRHRGPDASGVIETSQASLGCERLRIVDLRPLADQPFKDPETGSIMACNGEIYNEKRIRERYPSFHFRSHSDVEVILPLYREKGLAGLADLDGMFGIAIWDPRERALILARDRAGEKPLFFCRVDGEIWFASELQALLIHPRFSRDLDQVAIAQYAALGYIPDPRTPFQMVSRVEPGTIVRFKADSERVVSYWDPLGSSTRSAKPGAEVSEVGQLLDSAVRKQLKADVPVGVFLSGGIDSSLISAIAVDEAREGQLLTFSARFAEDSYDESGHAAEVAAKLGTSHHEVVIDESSMADALQRIVSGFAEPLADPAILPTYLLARAAREHVTVLMSGEGADEIFGGYPTYLGHHWSPLLERVPFSRQMLRLAAAKIPVSRGKVTIDFLLRQLVNGLDEPWPQRHFAWFGASAQQSLSPDFRAQGGDLSSLAQTHDESDWATRAMRLDYRTYLPGNLLVKNDRATMLNSVEARAPFLDPDLTSFALTLPVEMKIRGLTTKWVLKQAARKWLPLETIERKKRGLSVPIANWLDGGLRSEVDRLLSPKRIEREGVFDSSYVQRMLREHRAREANHARPLWTVVMFQYWLENWVPGRADRIR